jgi:hypothetical protein
LEEQKRSSGVAETHAPSGLEAFVRRLGILGVFVMLLSVSADADEAKKRCYDSLDASNQPDYAQGDQLYLTDNQCDAVAKRELRLKLFEIPQEDEDPMSLSVGAKGLGGVLRFKIPFSF